MTRVTESGDPRLEALFGGDARGTGVRPVVRLPSAGPSPWMIAAVALVAALLLFWLLDSRRTVQSQPQIRSRVSDLQSFSAEPPPLYIPPAPQQIAPAGDRQSELPVSVEKPESRVYPSPEPDRSYYRPEPAPPPMLQPVQQQAPRSPAGPALVIDTTVPGISPQGQATPGGTSAPTANVRLDRVRASGIANRSVTVPQGVLIPAVLETAFDSNHSGFARAIVSRNVRGFDGTRVLIPRGSRVIGEYQADAAPGQNRALIIWTRLIRPDGVTIALDSPAVDTLGRGGVRASVNTHFWDRFGNALLHSTVEIGSTIAATAAAGPLVVVPGAVQNSGPQPATRYVPTLKVAAGKSISIFVARDLEFPS